LEFTGRAWVFGRNVNTDLIFPKIWFRPSYEPGEMARHLMTVEACHDRRRLARGRAAAADALDRVAPHLGGATLDELERHDEQLIGQRAQHQRRSTQVEDRVVHGRDDRVCTIHSQTTVRLLTYRYIGQRRNLPRTSLGENAVHEETWRPGPVEQHDAALELWREPS